MPTNRRSAAIGHYGAGIAAGLIWGLAFLVPVLVAEWGPVTVTAGRYLAYGALSIGLVVLGGPALRRVVRRHWRPALTFAVTGNVGYYLLLVCSIELVGAPVASVVIGCIPVAMAVAGNLLTPRYAWRRLALPVGLVIVGMTVVNGLELAGAAPTHGASTGVKAVGVLAAFAAVALWTSYALANAAFLGRHPELSSTDWSTVVGVGTGVVTVVLLPAAMFAGRLDGPGGERELLVLLAASAVLGLAVSWGATALWNLASARLSPTAAGMLINMETLAGFTYVHLALGGRPPLGQLLGFGLVLVGVLVIVRLPVTAGPSVVGDRPPGDTDARPPGDVGNRPPGETGSRPPGEAGGHRVAG